MNDAATYAKQYLEDLISFFGLNIDVAIGENEEEQLLELDVPSSRLNGFLIGQRGDSLRSIQYLLNLSLKNRGYEDVVAVIDVAGYKKQRNQRIERHAEKIAAEVNQSGEAQELNPMSAYERRVVHKTVGEIDGVTSESTGEGRERRVVVKKAEE